MPTHSTSTHLVGIVNLTDDSFYDGGHYLQSTKAATHIEHLIEEGTDFIELGPCSSNPAGTDVPIRIQIQRIETALDACTDAQGISIDSHDPKVFSHFAHYQPRNPNQRWLLNDISGFSNPEIYPALAQSQKEFVIMHSVQEGRASYDADASPYTLIDRILSFFEERLEDFHRAGIDTKRCILDPGMGFFLGSNPSLSLSVLRSIERIRTAFNLPLMLSVSQKSFLGALTQRDVQERGAATLATEIWLATQHRVEYIRTHHPECIKDALRMWRTLSATD